MTRETKDISGVLLNKFLVVKKDKSFLKFDIGVQIGYKMEVKTVYQFEWDPTEEDQLNIGSDVIASTELSDKGYHVVQNIEEKIIFYCNKCRLVTTIDQVDPSLCEGCLMPEQERLTGKWEMTKQSEFTLKRGLEKAFKLFFVQEGKKLCLVAFPTRPFFDAMSAVTVGELVVIDGWRDDQRHSSIWQFSRSLKRKLQD